jgi:hypothetical protein
VKKVTILIVLLSLSFVVKSQTGLALKGDINEFIMRPVLVVLEAENSDFKKYFNENIKAIFKKYWPCNDSVVF